MPSIGVYMHIDNVTWRPQNNYMYADDALAFDTHSRRISKFDLVG